MKNHKTSDSTDTKKKSNINIGLINIINQPETSQSDPHTSQNSLSLIQKAVKTYNDIIKVFKG